MEDHLQSTSYCDHHHPQIQATATELKADLDDPVAIAVSTFYFVKDRIRFGFDRYRRKASATLTKGYGACWNKSLLLNDPFFSQGIDRFIVIAQGYE